MSVHEPQYPGLFPIAYGNEEETMLMVKPLRAPEQDFSDAETFIRYFTNYIPKGVKSVSEGPRRHTQAGLVMYPTGVPQPMLFERGTPECSTPTEIATAIQASEKLLVAMVSNYVAERAKNGVPEEMRIQRRTVDSVGNTAASHDSFEGRCPEWLGKLSLSTRSTRKSLLAHLATRSFMTGAGYVSHNGAVHYAQKVQSLNKLEGYGYINSAFRNASSGDTGSRYEVRCNDVNISPWAIRSRVGGMALVFTAHQTPLHGAINGRVPTLLAGGQNNQLAAFRLYNNAYLEEDGTIKASEFTHQAVDFQEWQFTLMGKHLGKYIEISQEYRDIIEGNIQYCHDFRKVLNGQEDISTLSNRSDNAAKFSKILKSVQRGLDNGIARRVNDITSRMWDMRYDNIRIVPKETSGVLVEYGYGYKDRDKGHFTGRLATEAVERSIYEPPKTTRAHIRGNLIRRDKITTCEWASVMVSPNAEGLEDFSKLRVPLSKVLLSPEEQAMPPEVYLSSITIPKIPDTVFLSHRPVDYTEDY
jgi:hypothetical protein